MKVYYNPYYEVGGKTPQEVAEKLIPHIKDRYGDKKFVAIAKHYSSHKAVFIGRNGKAHSYEIRALTI